MKQTKHLHSHRLVNVGIVFVLLGLMVFFYGLILSDPLLYSFVLDLNGGQTILHGVAPLPHVS
jgi:hypothetical protein